MIQSVGGMSQSLASMQMRPMNRPEPQQVFDELDTDASGSLGVDEL